MSVSTSMCVLSRVQLCVTPWTVAHSAPLSMEFPGKNTARGYGFLLQGIFRTQGLNPCIFRLLHWQAIYLPLHYLGSLKWTKWPNQKTQGG